MQPVSSGFRRFDFSFPGLDTLVRVEDSTDGVVIRASRDTFTGLRKEAFVRELAAEGFIPDGFRWFADGQSLSTQRSVRWVIDVSWLETPPSLFGRLRGLFGRRRTLRG